MLVQVMPEASVPYTLFWVDTPGIPDFWLYRCLRRFIGFLAHILALGFTVFLIILARPGTNPSMALVLLAIQSCIVLGFLLLPGSLNFCQRLRHAQKEQPGPLGMRDFCLCMTEAVLLLSPETSPLCTLSRKSKIRLHWLLQMSVPILAGTGTTFIVCSKNRSEQPHLTSWHSVLGLITLMATCCQAVCGFALLCPRLAQVSAVSRLKMYHATCGLMVYLLATATVVLGFYSNWFQAQIKGPGWYVCLVLPLYPALVIMNQVLDIYLPKKKSQI
ncbi:probable transmembrane reductase CYB561D1 isoform X2 [Pyxicephalus adspersus]|uniref:probable transmembrane reductase CYB561D1 isoform X2 n=1 Tax=Pyxicephalus adspersus TaxID=30357 RepID=UPI003B593345